MHRKPGWQQQDRRAETEAWKIIFSAFAVSGLLVIGWTLFVLFTDAQQRPTRVGASRGDAAPSYAPPAKP